MKAISIRPPWAWAILHAGKDIENRTWKTSLRGTVAVHASQAMSRPEYERAAKEIRKIAPRAKMPPYDVMLRGAVIGVVEIIGCEERTKSKWHNSGCYGFVLAKPQALPKSIDCKGRLGFWDLPDSLTRRISRQVK